MRNKAAIALVLAIASVGCPHRLERKVGPTLQTVDMEAPYLKCHMKNGDLYVLTHWQIDEAAKSIVGMGELHGTDRRVEAHDSFRVPIADVALFETNTVITSPGVAGMSVVAGLSAIVTTACLINPKACFGSCPTFYAPDDHDGRSVLQAEGFSDAISPALETNDIDSLWRTTGHGGAFTLTMTNEAYETHVVKGADLLAVPRPRGGRVLADASTLYTASHVAQPIACTAAEGDCLARVKSVDTDERTSLTDEHDLAARETIDLAFPHTDGAQQAIVLGARQSLVTTFLLYQGLAYLGTTATTWLAAFERGDLAAREGGRKLQKLVGGIEVQVEKDGAWHTVGEAYETGPLATDVHLVMLPPNASTERVRLVLPKGGWRIDSVALATIIGTAKPIRLAPTKIAGTISKDYNAGRTPASAFPIVTMPGDRYELLYNLPQPKAGTEYELFLDSRGYYLEWMRQEWLKEESPFDALRMFITPERMLRELAPAYKKLEPKAEELFWRSRYAHP